jgi:hypothetical protein
VPPTDDFYLHEDAWAMIALEADDNRFERGRVIAEGAAFAEAHRAPDGVGWTDLYVVPAPTIELDRRGITNDALRAALGPAWQPFARITSGYSSEVEAVASGFAYRLVGADDAGVIYGRCTAGVVVSLNVARPGPALADTLHRLGLLFRLILVDLWRDCVVELASPAAIARYLADDPDA